MSRYFEMVLGNKGDGIMADKLYKISAIMLLDCCGLCKFRKPISCTVNRGVGLLAVID